MFESKPNQNGDVHREFALNRREMLSRVGGGFGQLALLSLLTAEGINPQRAMGIEIDPQRPLAVRPPHFPASAKSVIFLFMDGGPSHIDTFDPKPKVNEYAGKILPASIKRAPTPMGVQENPILASPRTWTNYGESGLPVSEWYRHVGECVDDIAFIRSCWADGLNHVGSVCQMNTGSILAGRPSLGAWTTYGLGSENQDLPAFVVMLDNDKEPPGGSRVWGTGFMPATFQGTRLLNGKEPILHLANPESLNERQQRQKVDFVNQLNREHLKTRAGESELEARIAAYELAFRMQSEAPVAIDLAQETAETQELYGLNEKETAAFGRN
ncbi:MAG: DUF1501 domain-containing protein, partial [Planctomycetaceae bacterium]|nr:DUF1501 domain-containing protein [Planctomycetaceae bacterium]